MFSLTVPMAQLGRSADSYTRQHFHIGVVAPELVFGRFDVSGFHAGLIAGVTLFVFNNIDVYHVRRRWSTYTPSLPTCIGWFVAHR